MILLFCFQFVPSDQQHVVDEAMVALDKDGNSALDKVLAAIEIAS